MADPVKIFSHERKQIHHFIYSLSTIEGWRIGMLSIATFLTTPENSE